MSKHHTAKSSQCQQPKIGDLMVSIYAELLAVYGDEELASVATAAIVNEMVSEPREGQSA